MKSSVQDEKFSKIKSKCCALKKNIFAIMFILKKGHQPGVYVPLRALFLVIFCCVVSI